MKVIIQRVLQANCIVDEKVISEIGHGFMLLVGFTKTDTMYTIQKMVNKIIHLRVFQDNAGKMNLSIQDIDGEILSISQFTLYANPYHGNRPSFIDALESEKASILYNAFNMALSTALKKDIKMGMFGANMKLNTICDGPITIILEYKGDDYVSESHS